jgi:hypothetical protein
MTMSIAPIAGLNSTPALNSLGKKTDGTAFQSALKDAGAAPKSSADELADYVKMTPAQRLSADLLKKLGLTEEELAAMPPEKRQGVEAKIAELVKQQMQESGEKKGTMVNISA